MIAAWKLLVTAAFAMAAIAAYALLIWMNFSIAVSRCKGDKSKIHLVLLWLPRWDLLSSADTLHQRYGVSKDDMKIILEHRFYMFFEGVALGAVVVGLGYYVTMLSF